MKTAYPGVWIEEISTGARPIEAVGISTPAFLGEAAQGPEGWTEITNWSQYMRTFVGSSKESGWLDLAVYGFFDNGGSRCLVRALKPDSSIPSSPVGGGGGTGATAPPRPSPSVESGLARHSASILASLRALEANSEVAMLAAPGGGPEVHALLRDHATKMGDRVAILDSLEKESGTFTRRPDVVKADGGYAALYSPWIKVLDPLATGRKEVWAPPSGHVTGVIARTDAARGIHKAPANEVLRGVIDVEHHFTPGELEAALPLAINTLRMFPGDPPRIWGARTLAQDGEWKYLNVRRLFIMVRKSIERAMQWVVFEPNDRTLWNAIRRDLRAFLTRLWRQGALMGATPEQAFFVKCDEETNPLEEIEAGKVTTIIGLAPVRPAEFVVFQIGQYAGGMEVSEVGNG